MSPGPSALSRSLTGCHSCHQVVRIDGDYHHQTLRCPRCGARLHPRISHSVTVTWMLLGLALLFYIPANVLPMTRTIGLGHTQDDTIMSGVIYFIHSGSWYIGMIIFIASVFVPLLKIGMLILLLVSVQRGSQWRPRDRGRIYRITELVGRWSMVDIFVVALMVALVQVGNLATIEPGIGAIAFAAVVILTMIAAMRFDSRLIWDH